MSKPHFQTFLSISPGVATQGIYTSSKVTPNTAIAEHYQGPTPDQLNWNGIDIVKMFPR